MGNGGRGCFLGWGWWGIKATGDYSISDSLEWPDCWLMFHGEIKGNRRKFLSIYCIITHGLGQTSSLIPHTEFVVCPWLPKTTIMSSVSVKRWIGTATENVRHIEGRIMLIVVN